MTRCSKICCSCGYRCFFIAFGFIVLVVVVSVVFCCGCIIVCVVDILNFSFCFHYQSHVDELVMNGFAQKAVFANGDATMLDWLVVLQDASEKIPVPRFSHRANKKFMGSCVELFFSIQPLAFDFVCPAIDAFRDEVDVLDRKSVV